MWVSRGESLAAAHFGRQSRGSALEHGGSIHSIVIFDHAVNKDENNVDCKCM